LEINVSKIYPYPSGEGKVKWVSTDWLEEHLDDDILIMDVQPNVHDYLQEHIPGAVYLNEEFIRAWEVTRPIVFLPPETVKPYFRRAGVNKDKPVVVYTGKGPFKGWGDGLEQTMMAYSLARYGHDEVMILDGGIDKWKAEGRKIEQLFPVIEMGDFEPIVRAEYYIEYEEFKEAKERDDVVLLDARPPAFYEGGGPWGRPGHIPGAISLPWASLMDNENKRKLKPDEEILSILEEKAVTKDKMIICSCGTGREATNEFTLLKWYLGYPKVKIYEGSFTEWISYLDNPTVIGKNPR
jgi:thiosulfate/3-mercaptopyruvate sulfurtransferase